MDLDVLSSAESAARAAASRIAAEARAAVLARGRFVMALSGGSTPWAMLEALGGEDLPWERVTVVQVDERVAPNGDPQRNLTHLEEHLLGPTPLGREQLVAMPVETRGLEAAARRYARALAELAGSPPRLDLVHLGLGADGHTASLVPGDPVLDVEDRDVAVTKSAYQGHRRMTLTLPVLARARRILWLVSGRDKTSALERLWRGDPGIPAGRVARSRALLVADRAAASSLLERRPPRILVVDVGGTHVKVRSSESEEVRKRDSGPELTPQAMVDAVREMTGDWSYDVVSVGIPGPVMRGQPVGEPLNLGEGWLGFDFEKAFGRPVRVLNDAAMQALGSYEGGKMLFLGLGTGLGSALVIDGRVEPLELGHLPYRKRTYEDYVGLRGLRRLGRKKWRKAVEEVVQLLRAALEPETVVLGGGNAKKLDPLPPGVRLGNNANAFEGGFRLWREGR